MKNPIDNYWSVRLDQVKARLEKNGFDVFSATDTDEAKKIVLEDILPELVPKTLSWGGSVSFVKSGLYHHFRDESDFELLDHWGKGLSEEERDDLRHRSLLCDCFFAGTNALTEDGQLVNLDMVGNRVAPMMYGPKNVVLIVGRNKLVADLEGAMARIKEFAAPVNAMRLDMKTPCRKTGYCMDCDSPDRICNMWTIIEKCFPKGRIKIVLVNQDLGF